MLSAKQYAEATRTAMKALDTYKPEYESQIRIYADLLYQYDMLNKKYKAADYPFSEPTNAGSKKAPIVTTLESLRKDILQYALALGLNPKGLRTLKAEAPEAANMLERFLNDSA